MANSDTPVRLEVQIPGNRPTFYEVSMPEFMIGSVAGCDLVIPGGDLPPVMCVIARTADGLRLRKLAPNFKLNLNAKSIHHAPLTDGDQIAIGNANIIVHVPAMAKVPVAVGAGRTTKLLSYTIPLTSPKPNYIDIETAGSLRQMQQEAERLKQQARELESRRQALDAEENHRRQTWAERESQLEVELENARERRQVTEDDSQRDLSARQVELATQERDLQTLKDQLLKERAALESAIREHREDLARLDRQRGAVEQRETDFAARCADVERREQQVDRDAQLIEDRTRQFELELAQLRQDHDQVRRSQAEMELVRTTMAQRVIEIERQESLIKVQEGRLHQSRDELSQQVRELAEQKTRQDALEQEISARQAHLNARERDLTEREQTHVRLREELDGQQAQLQIAAGQLQAAQHQLGLLDESLKSRDAQLTTDRASLDNSIKDYREDLARSDRYRASLEEREQALNKREFELKLQLQRVEDESRRQEERSITLTSSEKQLHDEHERLRQLRADLEVNTSRLAEQSANTEGAQAVVLAVRTKLERLRDELRREAETLTSQRARQDIFESELNERQKVLDARAAELESLETARSRAQQALLEQDAAIRAATENLQALQTRIAVEEKEHEKRIAEMARQSTEHAEQAATLRAKTAQLLELQQEIDRDRHVLIERESLLKQSEQARAELENQLQIRLGDIEQKEKAVQATTETLARKSDELDQESRAVAADLARRTSELEHQRQQVERELAELRRELDARAAGLEQFAAKIADRENQLQFQTEKLKFAGQTLAAERKARAESKLKWEEEHRLAAEDLIRTRSALESFRDEVFIQTADLQKVLPDLELRGSAALDRLAQARDQLRHHVGEMHQYARQSQDDLETLRSQVLSETQRLREQQTALTKARSEHRHSVTAFRQQLIDWQGQVSAMKSSVFGEDSRFTQPTAELPVKNGTHPKKVVDARPTFTDMRDWFRWKLRELADSSPPGESGESTVATLVTPQDVIAFQEELDPGDRKLGELLKSLELVEEHTLTALLLEARRQRRSLRQVLLASGKLTVYQMALIEAGNLESLSIGPLGVIDRLRVTPYEHVFRVIDPRPGSLPGPLVLRHLTEQESQRTDRVDDFRARFKALTALRHPHIVATIEVMDIHGRPAALQEWLAGITSADWPSLVASPGVWYRLTCQALLGLATAQQAGFVHGGITNRSLVLTADGLVKLCGVGEPPWLNGIHEESSSGSDLRALGQVASAWASLTPKRRLSKQPRPLPPLVKRVLDQWVNGQFDSATAVLDALDQAGGQVPAGTEIWERLMKYAGANSSDGVAWRKSA